MFERSFAKQFKRNLSRRLITIASLSSTMLLAFASTAFAGGFQLSVETPGGSRDAQLKDAVLIARTYGCHQPADAKLSASAEGIVDGNRKSIPLELRSIGSGVYALKQQWPSEGTWVLAIAGEYNGMKSSVLVELGPNGSVFPDTRLNEGNLKGVHTKGARRAWAAQDLDAALKSTGGFTSEAVPEPDRAAPSQLGPMTWVIAGLGASVAAIGLFIRARHGRPSGEASS